MFGSQTNEVIYSSFAFIPIILILYYIYKKDRFPEPPRIVMITFFLGVATILPIQIFIPIIEGFGENLELSGESEHFYMAFVRAGFLEETAKWLVLIFYCTKLTDFNEPMDAIVYGAAIGLGYAAMENIPYLNTGDPETAWTMIAVRTRYYPLVMHLGFGVIMGWLLSLNLFEERSDFKRRLMLILSLLVPVIFHGVYNFYGAHDVFTILTLIMVFGIIYFYRREQSKRITEGMDKAQVDNLDVFYSYFVTFGFVALVVFSVIFVNN